MKASESDGYKSFIYLFLYSLNCQFHNTPASSRALTFLLQFVFFSVKGPRANAVKFSSPGKVIFINVTSENKIVTITIKDQGPGFHPNDLPHLFKKIKKLSAQPTAGESSTGLGLSREKALVLKAGGKIEVESEWGNGAAFKLKFPSVTSNTVPA